MASDPYERREPQFRILSVRKFPFLELPPGPHPRAGVEQGITVPFLSVAPFLDSTKSVYLIVRKLL